MATLVRKLAAACCMSESETAKWAETFDLPDYTTFRLFAQIEPIENFAIRVDVDNLFDEDLLHGLFCQCLGAARRAKDRAGFRTIQILGKDDCKYDISS